MDDNKDKIEEVQTDDITSTDTEKKDNKKKFIIISSIVASVVIIGLISWFVVTAIDKGKEFVNGVSDSVNNIAENIPSLELDITLESETTTELVTTTVQPITEEVTTEEPTTAKVEIETIDPNADPFTAVVVGSYTDEDYEYYVKIRTYENGAKRYVYHIDSENKDYEFSKIEEMPEEVALDMYEKMIADGSIISMGVTSTNEPTTAHKEEYVKPEISELEWLKEKYGNKITTGAGEYIFNEATNSYIRLELERVQHIMTSETTSEEIDVYMVEEINTVNWAHRDGYLTGYVDFSVSNIIQYWEGYYNEDLTKLDIDYSAIRNKNIELLKPIIKKETYGGYLTIHGLPISIEYNSYIYIQMYNSDGSEVDYWDCFFTIEEYYEFANSSNWTTEERTYIKEFINGSKEVTETYVILK